MTPYTLALAALAATIHPTPTLASSDPNTFDFVIVGGGTAGLALANRLSELPEITVAVVEAGSDESTNPKVTTVAGFGGGAGFNTHIDWAYETTEQIHAGGRRLEYHSGKAWGGTSTMNGMTYIRAEAAQIDAWETIRNAGWNWSTLWPYHLKSETFSTPTIAQLAAGASYIDSYHGRNGPLNVAYQYGLHNGTFASLVNETWQNLGMPFNQDASGGSLRGFFVWPQTLDREANVREDAARAYYHPRRGDRISWLQSNGSEAVADGVEYTTPDGKACVLHAKREVILAAGSVRSPAILELSGVGNPKILSPLGIEIKIPLPAVGENALEQPNSVMLYNSSGNNTFTGFAPYVAYSSARDIFGNNTQSISAEISSQLESWAVKTAAESNGALSVSALTSLYTLQHDLIFMQDVPCVEILTTAVGGTLASAFFILLPFSRGRVHVTSSAPGIYPAVDPGYFAIDFDRVLQREIAKRVARFWGTEPVGSLVGNRVLPTLQDVPGDATDEEWDDWVLGSVTANHHLLGTTAMLPRELGGVVNSNLTVYGTRNVRVVDASILPAQVSGHLTSIIYAVAERAGDVIKDGL
ncbi:hypothetical protein BJY04DRAFT_210719 [Aspergillus karnatakaensis]|uniref:GMC family oxidoreductase n=1 Tax=Aspergillus karnatakaensis TaxID=1810916 RepID=UPI003CCCBBB2